jgi:hypothetical protein
MANTTATMGQIVYNLEDYNSSNGYISTKKPNSGNNPIVYSKDYLSQNEEGNFTFNEEGYYNAIIDIYSNIVKQITEGKGWQKLGIQAPPGTRFMINDDREILVGRTGVYELSNDIIVTSLLFIQPKNYIYDDITSQVLLNQGKAEIRAAEDKRKQEMGKLDTNDPNYYEDYQEVQSTYAIEYEKALGKYNRGINGIYTLPYPDDLQNKANYKKLYNIIIDYVTE